MAVLHFNKNLERNERLDEDGMPQVKIVYPKLKNGEATVRSITVEPNFGRTDSKCYNKCIILFLYNPSF